MNNRWQNYLLLFLFLNFLLFISCKKEVGNERPNVAISLPLAQSSYGIYDTVFIKALVSDDEQISRILIQLKDLNNVPVLSKRITVNSRKFELSTVFPLDDPSLNGSYYIDVRAYDKDDFTSAFRYINIGGVSKELNKVFIISEGNSKTEISELTLNEVISKNVLFGDFHESAIDVDGKILYSMGRFDGDLVAMDTNGSELWKYESAKIPLVPFFNDLYYAQNNIYAALNDGRILGFDNKGNRLFEKVLVAGYAPEKILRHEDLMIYEKIEKNSGKIFLTNDHFPSGTIKGDLLFNYGRVVEFFSNKWNEVLIFSNANEGPYILKYNTENITISTTYFDKNSADFKNAIRIDGNTLMVTKGDELMKYYIEQSLLISFKKSFAPDLMKYDPIKNVLWCAMGNKLIQIDAKTGIELNTYVSNRNIDSFELFFSF